MGKDAECHLPSFGSGPKVTQLQLTISRWGFMPRCCPLSVLAMEPSLPALRRSKFQEDKRQEELPGVAELNERSPRQPEGGGQLGVKVTLASAGNHQEGLS